MRHTQVAHRQDSTRVLTGGAAWSSTPSEHTPGVFALKAQQNGNLTRHISFLNLYLEIATDYVEIITSKVS